MLILCAIIHNCNKMKYNFLKESNKIMIEILTLRLLCTFYNLLDMCIMEVLLTKNIIYAF